MLVFSVVSILLFGLVFGSFLNVVIYRVPKGDSIVFPPSHCPNCEADIEWYDNIPVLSWFLLDGTCRHCDEPISLQYPIVELVTAALSVALWIKIVSTGPTSEVILSGQNLIMFGFYAVFIYLLITISVIDLEHMIVPHKLTLLGIGFGLLTPVTLNLGVSPGSLDQFWPPTTLMESILGIVAGGLVIIVIFYGYLAIRGIEGIGGGDVTLMSMVGGWLGWPSIIFVLFAASLQGLLAAGIASGLDSDFLAPPELIDFGEEADSMEKEGIDGLAIPFGPFIALAALEHFFLGGLLPPYLSMSYLYMFGF